MGLHMGTNRLQSLPLELLEKIIKWLPALDILRVGQVRNETGVQTCTGSTKVDTKQVNRGFHDLIQRSPQIQHKLDLSAAGLEPNWSTDFTLADRVTALEEYRSRWESINIDKHYITIRLRAVGPRITVGGVYSIPTEGGVEFCTLSSSFRAIEPKAHKIPIDPKAVDFAFSPHADVIVVAVPIDGVL